jgi:hypothetical protein
MRPALAIALALLAAPTLSTAAAKRGAGRHPDTGGDQQCERCHREATPDAFATWSRGKHGEVLVTCVVCHGSTGADFARRPAADRCAGCHAEQVATMRTPAMKGKSCFSCHPAHALGPHGRGDGATARTKDVSRTDLSTVAFPDGGVQSIPNPIQPAPPATPGATAPPGPASTQAAPAAPVPAKPSGAAEPRRNVPAEPAAPATKP